MQTHHAINYIEFRAEDLELVKDFYGKVFGWKFTDYGPEYVAFNDGTLDGGFAKTDRKPERSGRGDALVIIYSDNLEASAFGVEQNGGKIIEPIFDFPGGRRFHFQDPAGNELAVWSAV